MGWGEGFRGRQSLLVGGGRNLMDSLSARALIKPLRSRPYRRLHVINSGGRWQGRRCYLDNPESWGCGGDLIVPAFELGQYLQQAWVFGLDHANGPFAVRWLASFFDRLPAGAASRDGK